MNNHIYSIIIVIETKNMIYLFITDINLTINLYIGGIMDTKFDINLALIGEEAVSAIAKAVYKEELENINSRFPLNDNEVDIKQIYYIKNDNNLEFSFFIRNGLNHNLALENMVLVIQNNHGKEILSKKINFKEYGTIPPRSATPFTVNFELTEETSFDVNDEYKIVFGGQDKFDSFTSVSTEIENIPIDISFEEEQELKDFFENLKTLEVNEFTVSLYKFVYNNNGSVNCSVILRNGYERFLNIGKLPVSILDEEGNTIVRKVFINEKGDFRVSPRKAKIVNLEFKPQEISDKPLDISKCRVMFK
jgi:SLAP domain-containing protein